jgi:hypothetical protein
VKGPTLTKLGDRTFVSRKNLANWLKTRELKEPRSRREPGEVATAA